MCEPGLDKYNHKDGNCAGVVLLSGIKDGGLRFLVSGRENSYAYVCPVHTEVFTT